MPTTPHEKDLHSLFHTAGPDTRGDDPEAFCVLVVIVWRRETLVTHPHAGAQSSRRVDALPSFLRSPLRVPVSRSCRSRRARGSETWREGQMLRNTDSADHRFRCNRIMDSATNRSRIPTQSDHGFRCKRIADSDAIGSRIPGQSDHDDVGANDAG